MNETSNKLAASLEKLSELQSAGVVAIQTKQLSRVHRERLIKHGFIREVIRGWYIASKPDEKPGDSTPWYTSFWFFFADYFNVRIGNEWCLYPEQSINLHIGDRTVPQQLLVRSPLGNNKPTNFIHDTSILDVKLAMPAPNRVVELDGIKVYSLPAAIVESSAKHYRQSPIEMQAALSMIANASDVLTILLEDGKSVVAGRVAGAFRAIGREKIANDILKGMDAADFKVHEINPFNEKTILTFGRRELSPYVNRIKLLWSEFRPTVIEYFPNPPSKSLPLDKYLKDVEDRFTTDAYHSLCIEGYQVTPELINLVRSGKWNLEESEDFRNHKDAMAAKGYWDAFQEVKTAVKRVLEGENAGEILDEVHGDWYLKLFGPSVAAGIVKQSDLAGYRTGPVYIRQSKHVPPGREAVRDMMPTLFDLLTEEDHPAVRVVLGHFIFVYIHPYFDGNGRIGRFIMNLMMASGGYPWTVIPVERRDDYMLALEAASVQQDIKPFCEFVASLLPSEL